MNPKIISVDAKAKTPKPAFRPRELGRLIRLACVYRSTLALGLLATVAFACLHTVSVGGAFPVFKLLLEEEGLRGWVDRTVAGGRLGVSFGIPDSEGKIRILSVDHEEAPAADGIQPGARIWPADDRSPRALLAALASSAADQSVEVYLEGGEDVGGARKLSLTPVDPDLPLRLLRWGGTWIPASAEANRLRMLSYLMGILVAVIVTANVFRYLGEVLISKAILRAMMRLRSQLYERTLQLPMSFFSGRTTSDLVGRFVQDIQEIQRGLLTLFSKFIREPLRAVFVLGLAIALDWRLTLTVLVVTPLVVAIFWRVGQSVKKSNRKLLQAYGRMIGALTASLQDLRVVKAFTAEAHERDRLRHVDLAVLKQQLKLARLQAFVSPMMETIAVVAASFITVWLAGRVLDHELSMSKFAALGVTLSVLFDPLRKLSDVYVRMQRATAGAERIFQVIDEPIEGELGVGDRTLGPLERAIEFENVSFTYPGAEMPALEDVSLTVRKGETVAIVGPNGCGKTTLISMLPRLYSPDSGVIRYDGVDIRDVTLKSLRSQIGLVSQEAIVFEGTPSSNIAYGVPEPAESDVADAARRASADEFIRNIPGGYQAPLAERGGSLSGGQRQRLAIARAIFRDAPILIFDEATSQIDSESELKIQQALREFAKGRTTIVIAHRLSTIQFADRIVVMDGGRIIDAGNHADLYRHCDLYRNLCDTQLLAEPTTSDTL